jgi:hypothetical protein
VAIFFEIIYLVGDGIQLDTPIWCLHAGGTVEPATRRYHEGRLFALRARDVTVTFRSLAAPMFSRNR